MSMGPSTRAVTAAFSWRLAVAALAVSLLTAVTSALGPPAAADVRDGLIAFDTSVGIHVVAADGSDRRTLVAEPGARHPRFSPDGSMIAFHDNGDTPDPSHINVMNADGSDRQRLMAGENAEWTPDGRALIFRIWSIRDPSEPVWSQSSVAEVARLDLASGEVELLPAGRSANFLDTSLSPDGTRVAFMGTASMQVAALDNPVPSRYRYPIDRFWQGKVSWVDDQRLIYSCRGSTHIADLCVLHLPSGQATRLTTTDYWEHTAVYSPTGDRVLVAAMDGLYVMDPDGGNVTWLHQNPGLGGSNAPAHPSWQGIGRDLTQPCETDSFTDVCRDATHAPSIEALTEAGITSGYPDGTFRPAEPVTRAQMATFLTTALQLPPGSASFPDTAHSVHADAIAALAQAGITAGYPDGTFRPAEPVTRAQMATFLTTALDL